MGRLIYSAIASLDGFTEDAGGGFAWAAPDAQVHAFVNAQERAVGTYLYGRRMYETMAYWETAHEAAGQPDEVLEYAAIWQAADKVVFSTTLESVSTARTRIEPAFDPAAVRALKAEGDLSVGGPGLAAQALQAGLVDELQLFLFPVVVGAGKRALPPGLGLSLTLTDERRFDSGVVWVRYGVAGSSGAAGAGSGSRSRSG